MSKMLSNRQWAAVCEKAKLWGDTVREYLEKAKYNFVVVETCGNAIHWSGNACDYVVYGGREDAEVDLDTDAGDVIMTEYDYLVSMGFDWNVYESEGLI